MTAHDSYMTASTAQHILVVDDEKQLRQFFAETLIDAGYRVDIAEDGAVGWDKLEANKYDLLLTDNKMPKVTGVELIRKVRAAHMTLPVIMVTATPPEDLEELQLAAILEKPFGLNQLLRLVDEALHRQWENRIAPKLKKIARELLLAENVKPSGDDTRSALQVFHKLRGPLSQLMGAAAFSSLMTRALALAVVEIPWLHEIRISVDGSLENQDELVAKLDARTAVAGETMLVAQLLGLLVSFIGPAVTLQVLRDTWPDLHNLHL